MSNDNLRDTWTEWSKYVLEELKDLKSVGKETQMSLMKLHVDIAALRTKAAILGGIAGVAASFLLQILAQLVFSGRVHN